MAADKLDESQADTLTEDSDANTENSGGQDSDQLNLEVEIASPSACERHVTVTVSRNDIERYLDDAYSELMSTANVPGFRVGRAPRKLVEKQVQEGNRRSDQRLAADG